MSLLRTFSLKIILRLWFYCSDNATIISTNIEYTRYVKIFETRIGDAILTPSHSPKNFAITYSAVRSGDAARIATLFLAKIGKNWANFVGFGQNLGKLWAKSD